MRGAVGNQMRRRGVLRTITNKPSTFSLSTLPPCRTLSSFAKDGREFSSRYCDAPDRLSLDRHMRIDNHLRFRGYSIYDSEFCIKHLKSGLKFSFNAYNALFKSDQERKYGDPAPANYSNMPSYASPFLPLIERQCDSAYVGNIFLEKPGKKPKNIDPTWELIDCQTLREQFQWMSKNEHVSTVPIKYTHCDRDGPTFFVTNRKKEEKTNGLLSPLVNFEMPLYVDLDAKEDEKSSCNFSLVVTDRGWFVRLYQLFCSYFGDTRERIMTMHCNFEQNIVYREIVDQQSEDFEKRVSQLKKTSSVKKKSCPLSYVHFHEVKQLKLQEPEFMRRCDHNAAKYSSFTVREWKEASLEGWNISNHKIASLLSHHDVHECKVVPLFRHPYNPVAFSMDRSVGTAKKCLHTLTYVGGKKALQYDS